MRDSRVIIALDYPNETLAWNFLSHIDPKAAKVKIGKQLFTATGPDFVKKVIAQGFDVFLDLKFHDIPSTVAKACEAAAELNVWMLNVHAMGGKEMLLAARRAIDDRIGKKPLLIGVTVLTSHDNEVLKSIGFQQTSDELVFNLAKLCFEAGLDGVVCSAQEAKQLRQYFPEPFCLVTPGIRLTTDNADDQKRIVTPQQAIADGADYLVIGRPITQAQDPQQVLRDIEILL